MDNAVALVQAYLRVNGYFTVAEYPVIEALRGGGYQAATDLDILGFRFPGAGRLVVSRDRLGSLKREVFAPDPELGSSEASPDMVIGEVKEGRAELNHAARNPSVLQVVLKRFGCCRHTHAPQVVEQLLRRGQATTPSGHQVRLLAFGSITSTTETHRYQVISLAHVTKFLREYIRQHWDVLRHAQFKDPAFGFLVTLEKAERGN
jgi:hypothetical protein